MKARDDNPQATSAIDNIVDTTSSWNKARQAPENNPFRSLPIWDVQRLESARDGISHFSWETKKQVSGMLSYGLGRVERVFICSTKGKNAS
jgi:hypothetical protein